MRFYLAVMVSFVLMLCVLSRCEAQGVITTGLFQLQSKGGEAAGKQLHRKHRSHSSLRRRHALSVAVFLPRPRPNLELSHPERYPHEAFWTPQRRITETFQQLEEAYAGISKRPTSD